MKVEKGTIKNYKGIDNMTLTPGKRTVFIGKNGVGKSSAIEALRYGVTGDYEGSPVRFGSSEMEVEIEFDSGDTIKRIMKFESGATSNKVKVNGKNTTQKSVDELMSSWSGTAPQVRKIITSAPLMRAMNGGQLSEFLTTSGLIPLNVTINDIIGWFTFSEAAEIQMRSYFPEAPEKIGLDDINHVYDEVKSARTANSRQLKDAKARAKWEKEIPSVTVEELDRLIERQSDGKTALAAYEAKKLAHDDAVMKRAKQETAIAEVEAEIAKFGIPELPNEDEKRNAEKQLKCLQENIGKVSGSIAVHTSNLKSFEKMIKMLEGSMCPLSPKIVCSTDKSELVEEINGNIEMTKGEIEKAIEEKGMLEGRKGIFEAQIAKYNKAVEENNILSGLSTQLKALRTTLLTVPELPEKPSITIDESAISALKAKRKEAIEYEATEKAKIEVSTLETSVMLYDELVNALNPKGGIREKVIDMALSPLVNYCNARADEMHLGIEIAIAADNGTHVMCKTKSSKGFIYLENASVGQQAVVMFLIMDMLNALSGLGILFLDGLETLDNEAFEALLNVLESAESTYSNIFIATVDHDDMQKVLAAHSSWEVHKL